MNEENPYAADEAILGFLARHASRTVHHDGSDPHRA
jgi:hypothetical protein